MGSRDSVPLALYVFADRGKRWVHRYGEAPAFDGSVEVRFAADAGRWP